MNIPSYTLLFFIGGCTLVLRLKNEPKALNLIQFATLIIPPNDVSPKKDRFGIFNSDIYPVLETDEQALAELEAFRRKVRHLNDCAND